MGSQKALMIIVIALLVILLAAVSVVSLFGYRYLTSIGGLNEAPAHTGEASNYKLKLEEIEKVALSSEITTNLMQSRNGADHYVKVQLTIGVNNTDKKKSPGVIESLHTNESVTRDIVLGILRSQTYEDLCLPEGQDLLKESIKIRLQDEYETELIAQVYVSDLVLS